MRMVMEAANGHGRGRRQHHGGNGTCWGGGGETCDGRSGGGSKGDDSDTERVVVSPITPATRAGQNDCEYVSTRTHPLTP